MRIAGLRISVALMGCLARMMISAPTAHCGDVTERECKEYLKNLQRLAKDGCGEEFRSTLNQCGTASAALLGCLVLPDPESKLLACLSATFETKQCAERAGPLAACDLMTRLHANELAPLRDGDCFAFVNGDGCSLICLKKGDRAILRGVIDPTQTVVKDAVRFFPLKKTRR